MSQELTEDDINQLFWDMAAAVQTIETLIDREDEESKILVRKNMLFLKLCLTKEVIRAQIPDLTVFKSVLCCTEHDAEPKVAKFINDWANNA